MSRGSGQRWVRHRVKSLVGESHLRTAVIVMAVLFLWHHGAVLAVAFVGTAELLVANSLAARRLRRRPRSRRSSRSSPRPRWPPRRPAPRDGARRRRGRRRRRRGPAPRRLLFRVRGVLSWKVRHAPGAAPPQGARRRPRCAAGGAVGAPATRTRRARSSPRRRKGARSASGFFISRPAARARSGVTTSSAAPALTPGPSALVVLCAALASRCRGRRATAATRRARGTTRRRARRRTTAPRRWRR